MNIYYFLIFNILLLGIVLQPQRTVTRKMIYCFIISIILIIVSGLRHLSVGNDTWNYVNIFYRYNQMSINELFQNHFGIEFGYVILNKFIGSLSLGHQWLLLFTAVVFTLSVSKFIYDYSNDVVLSYLVLFSFSFFQFSMTGVRQTLAISIVIFGIKYALDKKLIKFSLVVLLASTFHQSALVAFFIYLATYFKMSKLMKVSSIVLIAIVYVLRNSIVNFLFMFIPDGRYNYLSDGGGETVLLVVFLTFIVGLMFHKNYDKVSRYANFEYGMIILGILFQVFTPVQNIFFRIAMYFTIILVVFIPNLFSGFKSSERLIMKYMIYIALLVQYFIFTKNAAGVVPHEFFWLSSF